MVGLLVVGATAIFCKGELIRPLFNVESDSLQTFLSDLEFEPDTLCPVISAINTREAGGRKYGWILKHYITVY